MLSFETYTASLKSKGDAIDSTLAKADTAFANFDSVIDKITTPFPALPMARTELFEKMKSMRELADSFKKRSAIFMDDGRETLLDVSEGANEMTHKIDPPAAAAGAAAPAAAEAAVEFGLTLSPCGPVA